MKMQLDNSIRQYVIIKELELIKIIKKHLQLFAKYLDHPVQFCSDNEFFQTQSDAVRRIGHLFLEINHINHFYKISILIYRNIVVFKIFLYYTNLIKYDDMKFLEF